MLNRYVLYFALLILTLIVYMSFFDYFFQTHLLLTFLIFAYLIFFIFRNLYQKEKDLYDVLSYRY